MASGRPDYQVKVLESDLQVIDAIKVVNDLLYMDLTLSQVTLTNVDQWYAIKTISLADGDLRIDVGTTGSYNFVRVKIQFTPSTTYAYDTEARVTLDDVQQGQTFPIDAVTGDQVHYVTFGIDPSAARTIKIEMRKTEAGTQAGLVSDVFLTATIMETQA